MTLRISLLLILVWISLSFTKQTKKMIRYLPLGDSYTICTGTTSEQSWPRLLTAHLNEKGISCTLTDNPARNGFTTQNLIDRELPVLKEKKPDLVTLLIGVNDWVQGVPASEFHENLAYILNEVRRVLPDKDRILLITIPDFGVTPSGKRYANGRDISAGISEFNAIIKAEASKRHLPVVDLFEISKHMGTDRSLVAADGLHPSAKEYAIWETLILPEAEKLLKKN